jgi:hypothetical protein
MQQKDRRDDDGDWVTISTNPLVPENESKLNHKQARNIAVD